jgi:RNAse (barnase) inhibitor barstar
MRIIELDAAEWKTLLDFYNALLQALGAPKGHGCSIDALLDSMVWGGMNSVEPPYTIRIRNTRGLAPDIREAIDLLALYIPEDRAAYRAREGEDVDVNVEIVP